MKVGTQRSACEWKVLFNAILVRFVDQTSAPQAAAALGILGLQKMPLAGA